MSYSTTDEVLKRANLANAGLGATVYSKDIARAEAIARRLETGSVWINKMEMPNPAVYMGGIKESGIGGEGGKHGLRSYAHTKSLYFSKV